MPSLLVLVYCYACGNDSINSAFGTFNEHVDVREAFITAKITICTPGYVVTVIPLLSGVPPALRHPRSFSECGADVHDIFFGVICC